MSDWVIYCFRTGVTVCRFVHRRGAEVVSTNAHKHKKQMC